MIQRILELEGYRVLVAGSGDAALDMLVKEVPNLVLLDIMMPGMDGYEVCKRIREFTQVPLIMVTAKVYDEDKVKGLDAGADDYITKPFSSSEPAARVRAALRRTRAWNEQQAATFCSDQLVVDFTQHKVTLEGREINLTTTEYRLLSLLARNAGRVVTSAYILENVWGEEYTCGNHLLHVNISRLRQKLREDVRNSSYISTRPGIGYVLVQKT
jgi:two-component system KDP operon response regulator KdpE